MACPGLACSWNMKQCPSPALCRYRKFSIAEDVDIIVRCQIDGVMPYKGEEQLLSVKALNEFDSKTTGKPALLCRLLCLSCMCVMHGSCCSVHVRWLSSGTASTPC